MTLGEINFVDVYVEQDNSPFTVDAYIIVTLFMIVMPIALMNLLVRYPQVNVSCCQNFLKL
jgi:hypothetical protein